MMTTRSLPEEVVIEILLRLPALALIRSRCVCKSWLRLLTLDLHFHKLHLHRLTSIHPKPNPSILLSRLQSNSLYLAPTDYSADEAAVIEIPCPFNISSRHHTIYGICNGLVCLASCFQEQFHHVYVWNPLTRDHVTIPYSPIAPHFPTASTTFGFGFCQVTQQFKIIRVLSSNSSEVQSNVSVYTLGTNSWRMIGSIPNDINILEHSTALVNNALHWIAGTRESFVWNLVLSFNMKEENFQVLPHPDAIHYDYPNHVTIGELGGLLCIFCAASKQYLQIWVMKEYGVVDSWTKQFTIGHLEVEGSFYYMQPLGLVDGGEIMILKNEREIILYNPSTNSTRRHTKFGFEVYVASPFNGSLVSPRIVNGVNTLPI